MQNDWGLRENDRSINLRERRTMGLLEWTRDPVGQPQRYAELTKICVGDVSRFEECERVWAGEKALDHGLTREQVIPRIKEAKAQKRAAAEDKRAGDPTLGAGSREAMAVNGTATTAARRSSCRNSGCRNCRR